jgi:hypothetical protein
MTRTTRVAVCAVAAAALVVPATGAARVASVTGEAAPRIVAVHSDEPHAVPPWRLGRPCHHGLRVDPQTGAIVGPVSHFGAVCIEL